MKKEIKDYLPFYLGCELLYKNGSIAIMNPTQLRDMLINQYERNEWKPILRPLSDMTEDEKIRLSWENQSPLLLKWLKEDNYAFKASEFKYLLSKHFDLFGLIESGLAIDATTLNKETKS